MRCIHIVEPWRLFGQENASLISGVGRCFKMELERGVLILGVQMYNIILNVWESIIVIMFVLIRGTSTSLFQGVWTRVVPSH